MQVEVKEGEEGPRVDLQLVSSYWSAGLRIIISDWLETDHHLTHDDLRQSHTPLRRGQTTPHPPSCRRELTSAWQTLPS